jgi:hypothetical protein
MKSTKSRLIIRGSQVQALLGPPKENEALTKKFVGAFFVLKTVDAFLFDLYVC